MKFKVGDPVWARSAAGDVNPPGEYVGTVVRTTDVVCPSHNAPFYGVEIPDLPVESPLKAWLVCESRLRPRRDDYQQHEPRVRRSDLPMNENASLQEILQLLHEELS